MSDDRYDHKHPRHRELMLPCYPACQEPDLQKFADTAERYIDRATLHAALEEIAGICRGKAEHIRSAWQDVSTARVWDSAAGRIERLANEVHKAGL